MEKSSYIHGTDSSEQARLTKLNELTNPAFIEFLEFDDTGSVLEVGSGLGILAREIANLLPFGKVFGIEYSSRQLKATKNTTTNLYTVQGDAHYLPFKKNYFDAVYCRYLLEHVKDPVQVLNDIHRVLKPDGKIFVQENNILINMFYPECPHFDAIWKQFAVLQEKLGGDALIGKKLFSLLQKAGFENIELSYQPEIHYSGKPTFKPWIENLIGNVQGGAEQLLKHQLATKEQIEGALAELKAFMEREDASALFYWNRAKGVKG